MNRRGKAPVVLQVLPRDGVGGTEHMLAALMERVDPAIARMELVTLDRPGPVARRVAALGLPVRCLGGRGLAIASVRLARLLAEGRYDVIVAYGFKATAISRVLSRALAPSASFICGIRGLHVTELESPTGPKARVLVVLERLASPLVDIYDANSRGALQVLSSAGVPLHKLWYIPNGIDPRGWSDGGERGTHPPTALCVARFVPRKRHRDLIEAVRLLSDEGLELRLLLAGDGPTLKSTQLESSELEDKVRFLGEVTGAELKHLYCEADIFCICSLWEGMAGSVMEAMAAGLPVVGTDVNGVADLVVDGETGLLVAPRCPDQLARALKTLILEPELRARLGEAGRTRIRTSFSLDEMVVAKQTLYRTAAGVA